MSGLYRPGERKKKKEEKKKREEAEAAEAAFWIYWYEQGFRAGVKHRLKRGRGP